MSYTATAVQARPPLMGHVRIVRADHWIQNAFILPGRAATLAPDSIARANFPWPTGGPALRLMQLLVPLATIQ